MPVGSQEAQKNLRINTISLAWEIKKNYSHEKMSYFFVKLLIPSHIHNFVILIVKSSKPCKIEYWRMRKLSRKDWKVSLQLFTIVDIPFSLSIYHIAAIPMTFRRPRHFYVLFVVFLSGTTTSTLFILRSNAVLASINTLYHCLQSQVLLSNLFDKKGA